MVLTPDFARAGEHPEPGRDALDELRPQHLPAWLSLPARAASIAVARAWARNELRSLRMPVEARERTVLVLSDLASCVVESGTSTWLTIQLTLVPALEVKVHARHPLPKAPRRHPLPPAPREGWWDDVEGRGLQLVAALSDHWGAHPTRRGSCLWAKIDPAGCRPTGSD